MNLELKLYCVKDAKVGMNQPYVANNDLDAMRSFQDTINREPMPGQPKSTLAQHPEDFSLFQLGTFNQQTGEIKPEVKFLIQAVDLVKKAPKK